MPAAILLFLTVGAGTYYYLLKKGERGANNPQGQVDQINQVGLNNENPEATREEEDEKGKIWETFMEHALGNQHHSEYVSINKELLRYIAIENKLYRMTHNKNIDFDSFSEDTVLDIFKPYQEILKITNSNNKTCQGNRSDIVHWMMLFLDDEKNYLQEIQSYNKKRQFFTTKTELTLLFFIPHLKHLFFQKKLQYFIKLVQKRDPDKEKEGTGILIKEIEDKHEKINKLITNQMEKFHQFVNKIENIGTENDHSPNETIWSVDIYKKLANDEKISIQSHVFLFCDIFQFSSATTGILEGFYNRFFYDEPHKDPFDLKVLEKKLQYNECCVCLSDMCEFIHNSLKTTHSNRNRQVEQVQKNVYEFSNHNNEFVCQSCFDKLPNNRCPICRGEMVAQADNTGENSIKCIAQGN